MNTIRRRWVGGAMAVGMALLSMAQGAEIISDTFSDGSRNEALWKFSTWNDAKFEETGGRVLFTKRPGNTETFQVAGWSANFDRVYNDKDYLDVQIDVRAPHKIKAGKAYYELGIGIYESRTDHNYIELTVMDSVSNRQFGVYYSKGIPAVDQYISYPAPTNSTMFRLRLRYSAATDKVSFFWAPANSSTWTTIRPPLKMKTIFGRGIPHTMRPYMVGYMEDVLVPASWNVYLDNFLAIYGNVPL
jgi:hypothetical protein